MDNRAIEIVRNYIEEHVTTSDTKYGFDVFIVWKAKALQNWKYILSSRINDNIYELTYNGDKGEWYLDIYHKYENRVIIM